MPQGGACIDPRATVSRIYKEDHYTMLHTKYESYGPCGFEEDFLCFSHDAPRASPVWTPGAWLAGFVTRTTIHCYTQNMKALGLVVSEKKIFLCFPHCMSMGANDPTLGGAIFDSRGMFGRIYKKDYYILLNIKYKKLWALWFRRRRLFYVVVFFHDTRGWGHTDPRGTVCRIYKEDHYTLLHTKYESSGPCSFGEEDFFMFFP